MCCAVLDADRELAMEPDCMQPGHASVLIVPDLSNVACPLTC